MPTSPQTHTPLSTHLHAHTHSHPRSSRRKEWALLDLHSSQDLGTASLVSLQIIALRPSSCLSLPAAPPFPVSAPLCSCGFYLAPSLTEFFICLCLSESITTWGFVPQVLESALGFRAPQAPLACREHPMRSSSPYSKVRLSRRHLSK